MGKSSIEWTERTWNPIVGCSKVSAGCKNCYAERMAVRLAGISKARYCRSTLRYTQVITDGKWNGKTHLLHEMLDIPLKRKKATTYFVCSMSDLFHESVPFEWIDKVFAVMRQCDQHTFQVLTKRPERMAEYLSPDNDRYTARKIADLLPEGFPGTFDADMYWPLDNVWLGTTAENQAMADKRIPELLKCPAAKRFVSVEPMLSAVNFRWRPYHHQATSESYREYLTRKGSVNEYESLKMLDWVICGGESGPGARPMHPDWARSIRDQCKAAGVPFFFKQWGKHVYPSQMTDAEHLVWDVQYGTENVKERPIPLGKKRAGSLLDGVEYKEYPI